MSVRKLAKPLALIAFLVLGSAVLVAAWHPDSSWGFVFFLCFASFGSVLVVPFITGVIFAPEMMIASPGQEFTRDFYDAVCPGIRGIVHRGGTLVVTLAANAGAIYWGRSSVLVFTDAWGNAGVVCLFATIGIAAGGFLLFNLSFRMLCLSHPTDL